MRYTNRHFTYFFYLHVCNMNGFFSCFYVSNRVLLQTQRHTRLKATTVTCLRLGGGYAAITICVSVCLFICLRAQNNPESCGLNR